MLFGLTDKDFQLIAKNFAQIRNQLKVTNELLDKYKEYYEGDLENEDENRLDISESFAIPMPMKNLIAIENSG